MAFYLGRRFDFEGFNFLAFDQFELFQIINDDGTTESSSSDTSQSQESSTRLQTDDEATVESTLFTETASSDQPPTELTSITPVDVTSDSWFLGEQFKIYGCSFDFTDPLCTLRYRSNGSTPIYSLTQTVSQTVRTYRVTDFTSISKLDAFISPYFQKM